MATKIKSDKKTPPRVNFNIVDPKTEDHEFCKQLAKEKHLTSPKVLSLLVDTYKSKQGGVLNTDLEESLHALQAELDELKHKCFRLETENGILTEKVNEASQAQIVDKGAIIYTAPPSQLTNIRRYFALLRKKGKISGTEDNLPQVLIEKSINYFIKNEFPEVQK